MKTQALGWLAVGVIAAGLNGFYHDGGAEWLHRAADRVEHSSAAVLALASGRADAFLTEAKLLTARNETRSSQWATAVARIQTRLAARQTSCARLEMMSAREEAQLARVEAMRARMEARLASHAARLRETAVSFDSDDFSVMTPSCPRIRVSVPEPPTVRVQTPTVHVEAMNWDRYSEQD